MGGCCSSKAQRPNSNEPTVELLDVLSRVQGSSSEFTGRLNAFMKNKRGVIAVYSKSAPAGVLEVVVIETVPLLRSGALADPDGVPLRLRETPVGKSKATEIANLGTHEYRSEFLQQKIASPSAEMVHEIAAGPAETVDELFAAATAVLPSFSEMVHEIAAAVGGGVEVQIALLKDRGRVIEKAEDDYSTRVPGPAIGWVYDIVRMRFLCFTAKQIKAVLKRIIADPRVKAVLKGKNRFKVKTPNGFCDLLLHIMIAVEVDGTTVEHVCEIQIHLRHVTEYCEAQKSHESYNFFRVFFNGSMNTVAARLQDLEEIVGPGFAGKDTDIETPEAVLQRLVLDVETSKNVRRIEALELFCRDYLQEFELSLYMAQRKLDVQRATLQHDDHPDIGKSYTNMAFVIEKQGKFSEAEAMHKKALAIQLKTVGEGHIDVASTYNGLAICLKSQGKYDEALETHKKALAIKLQVLGPDDADVALTYHGMGVVVDYQDKFDEANTLYRKGLAIRLKTLGPDHPDVGKSYNNIALVLKNLGHYVESMAMYEKALSIKLKAWGPYHASVGTTYQGMAVVLRRSGKLDEALEMLKKVLEIKKKALKGTHTDIAMVYRNMAAVVYDQGKLDESVAIQERALALMVQTHEPAHTDVGLYKLYLGELVEEQKDYPRALKLLLEALECLNNLTLKLAEKGEKPKKRISTRTKDGNEAVERIHAAMQCTGGQ